MSCPRNVTINYPLQHVWAIYDALIQLLEAKVEHFDLANS